MAQGLSPSVPLLIDPRDGIKLNKRYIDLVNQNLKMLLLTAPGERIMDPHFGVGMRHFIFEMDHPTTYAELSGRIHTQVKKYLPYIEIEDLDFQSQSTGNMNMPNNTLKLRIIFNIKPLNRTSSLDLNVGGTAS